MSVERNNKCPNCGAILTGLELKCPECGYTLTTETTGGKNVTDSLLDLQEKLLAVDKVFNTGSSSSKKKASIINAFPIPNTAESLVRLLHMSYSNFEAAKEAGDNKLSVAWLGKAIESYRRLSEMQGGLNIGETLEKYKALGDKKAFSKLSGSRSKKRRNAIIGAAAIAAIVAFILLFDWAGWLMRSGKTDQAVRFLKATGRVNQAAEMLVEQDMVEDAADLLFTDGQMVNAVSLLAQKGLIKEALIMTGKTNNADTIHSCVDEIGKFRMLLGRWKVYLGDNIVVLPETNEILTLYNHSIAQWASWDNKVDSTKNWIDYWKIMDSFIIPQNEEFRLSPFQNEYYSLPKYFIEKLSPPDITRSPVNGLVTRIIIKDLNVEYEFKYDWYFDKKLEERVIFEGIPTFELSYDYDLNRGQLLAAHERYLLTKEERDRLFDKDRVFCNESSQTRHYYYSDGHLSEIKTTLDNYDDRLQSHYLFEYFDNVVFRHRSLRKSGSLEMEKQNDVLVKYYLGTSNIEEGLVEAFAINLDN